METKIASRMPEMHETGRKFRRVNRPDGIPNQDDAYSFLGLREDECHRHDRYHSLGF
jgi:hypothetical protein